MDEYVNVTDIKNKIYKYLRERFNHIAKIHNFKSLPFIVKSIVNVNL